MKERFALVVCVLVLICLCACQHKTSSNEMLTPTERIIPTPVTEPVASDTPTPEADTKTASHRITWEVFANEGPASNSYDEINRRLQEKGLDVVVEFVNVGILGDDDNDRWISEREQEGTIPDILNSGVWSLPSYPYHFIQEHFQCLDEYLASEKGQGLKSLFSEAEWAGAVSRGKTYVIPEPMSQGYDHGVFFSVRNEYADAFREFDGTYDKLKEIYASLDCGVLRIVTDSIPNWLINSFLGYPSYYAFPYDDSKHQLIDIASDPRLEPMLDDIFLEMKNGMFQYASLEEVDKNQVLGWFRHGIMPDEDGFTQICLYRDLSVPRISMAYGVSKTSEQKELALAVLEACYSDPEIQALLAPKSLSALNAAGRKSVLDKTGVGELSGFIPELPEDMGTVYSSYLLAAKSLQTGMFVVSSQGTVEIADDYHAKSYCEALNRPQYHNLLEEINDQIALHVK